MCRFTPSQDGYTEIEIQAEQVEPILEELYGDDLFLFCVGFSCEHVYNAGQDNVDYNKDATALVIMDIVARWSLIPNFNRILMRGIEDIICLTFMKPPFMQSTKSAIVRGMLHLIVHIPGLEDAAKENLKQQFYKMIRRLLSEDPTIENLSCLLDALTFYYHSEHGAEKNLAIISTFILLAHAMRLHNVTMDDLTGIISLDMWEMLNIIYGADNHLVAVDVFPALDYEE